MAARIGPRLARRPEPRFGVTLAGIGIALAIFGVVVLGTSGGGSGLGDGDSFAVGIVLSLALTAVGYLLLLARRSGPFATAGVAASALGVPVLMAFVTDAADAGTSTTINAVVLVSLVAWLISYLIVPGATGHVFYLASFTVVLWFYLLDKIEPDLLAGLVLAPFAGLRESLNNLGGPGSDSLAPIPSPDFNTVATVSILIGLIYYGAAYLLDRTGRSGPAVAFVVGGLPAMFLGLVVAAVNAQQSVEGVLIIVAGAVLGLAGARTGRRFTTWIWTFGVGVGIVVILADIIAGDQTTAAGIALIIIGAVLVALAHLLAAVFREPDETQPTPPVQARVPAA